MPRGGGWRPGARWAQDIPAKARGDAPTGAAPARRRPSIWELGPRSEAADHPFRAMPPDEGGHAGRLAAVAPVAVIAGQPLILVERSGQRELVAAACPAARALGLGPGMPVAHARALVPGLDIRPAEAEADSGWLERLAVHAVRHWTPIAAPSGPDGLWLDMTATAHLFGGEERFARRVQAFLRRLGFTARVAIADTPGAAHAIARFGGGDRVIVPAGGTLRAIAPLPVEALRLTSDATEAARRFGLDTVADLLPLPRAPLARRLGRDAILRLDQALGREAEPIAPTLIEEMPTAERRLLEPIGTPEAIGQVIDDLANDLAERLRADGRGVRALALVLLRVDGSEQQLLLGTAKATRDARHLARLVRLKLDTIDPGFGIEQARLLTTHAEPLGPEALGRSLAGDSKPADLAPLVDQLAARVGARAIFRVGLEESDVPERAVRRIDPLEAPTGWPSWRRPARLLRAPERLSGVVALLPDHPPRRFAWRGKTYAVVAGDGPERIHGEWWRRDGELWAVRDYFRVEVEGGGRYWLFRRGDGVDPQTGDLSWWLHGAG